MILEGLREKQIFEDNNLFRIAVSREENYSYPSHWHNALELIYVEKNNCTVRLNNLEYKLKERDMLLVAAGDIHSFQTYEGEGTRYFIQFDFAKLFGFTNSLEFKNFQAVSRIITPEINKTGHQQLEVQILKILTEYNDIKLASDIYINARLLDIAVVLSRSYSGGNATNTNSKASELTKLEKAFKYIEENYNKQIGLADAAKAAGFSEYHFSRVFKKATEKTFWSYLNEYRVKKAESLILDNSTMTEAAYAAGFNSIVTFNRIFKQLRGCSPSEYMKKRV